MVNKKKVARDAMPGNQVKHPMCISSLLRVLHDDTISNCI